MSDAVFNAFVSKHFHPIFALMAASSNAEAALEFDVPSLHGDAREGIKNLAETAGTVGADSAERVMLLQGAAGYGKTHRIITSLLELSRAGEAYPAVMQLSARVDQKALSLWMLQKLLDELVAKHFRDEAGRTPLKRMAEALWSHAPAETRGRFDAARENEEPEEVANAAQQAAVAITRDLDDEGLSNSDETLVAAILLLVDDASHEVWSWLRGGSEGCSIGTLPVPPLRSEIDCQRVIHGLTRIAAATGAPIVIAVDQIEAVTRVGDQDLLVAMVATVVQLVENSGPGLGIVISALESTYEDLIKGRIDDSFDERIGKGERPVKLKLPDSATIKSVIDRRVECLLKRHGVADGNGATSRIAPDWLLSDLDRGSLRDALDVIRQYRQACKREGRFLNQEEYRGVVPPAPPQAEDFDKLWEDRLDSDLGAVANYSSYDREQMFVWLAEHAAGELSRVQSTSAEPIALQDAAATRVVDVRFHTADGATGERWKVAMADAPNRNQKLQGQLRNFLDSVTDANPALLRPGNLPGVDETGSPDRPQAAMRRLQIGQELLDLFAAGGRAAWTSQKDWQRLNLAKEFFEDHKDAPGFRNWCLQRQFLLNHAGIGQMTQLVVPEGGGKDHVKGSGDEDEHAGAGLRGSQNGGASSVVEPPTTQDDSRDHLEVLLGDDPDGEPVKWSVSKEASPALPNFGLLVSGDAGQGKTQAIKAVIAETARVNCPILIFDFKNDYADSKGDPFATDNGFTEVDLNNALPFNPLKLPPHGPSGAQAINHVYEVAGILGATLKLGDQQKALLRQALEEAFTRKGIALNEWVDPDEPAPSFAEVVAIAGELAEKRAETLINRLGLLHGKRMLPSDQEARISFDNLLNNKVILSFSKLPNDDQLKRAVAELILVQLQGYMLRGDQPRALRRLLVFDEAWRAADSKRLIQLAREGRAFGVGVVAGSQFADDLSSDLTGNLASKLHLYNSDAGQRRKIVQATFGSTAGADANRMTEKLGGLKKFEAVFSNQQYTPYREVKLRPYFARKPDTRLG